VVALLLSFFVRTFIAQAFFVPSGSMENTLQIQDRILVSKLSNHFGGVQRGEIVVFSDPSHWLPDPEPPAGIAGILRNGLMWIGLLPSDTGKDLVKRVIGIGGDNVKCCSPEGRIVLNGVPLVEPYLKPPGNTDQVQFNITVPQGRIFVMGDNRGDSSDSRYHLDENDGTVPLSNVVGRVAYVIWPISSWSGEPIPDLFSNPALNNQPTPISSSSSSSSAPSGEAAPNPSSS
jgi:signal peptidase I